VITNHQRHRRTDRRTDGQTDGRTTCDPKTAHMHLSALRGKNPTVRSSQKLSANILETMQYIIVLLIFPLIKNIIHILLPSRPIRVVQTSVAESPSPNRLSPVRVVAQTLARRQTTSVHVNEANNRNNSQNMEICCRR